MLERIRGLLRRSSSPTVGSVPPVARGVVGSGAHGSGALPWPEWGGDRLDWGANETAEADWTALVAWFAEQATPEQWGTPVGAPDDEFRVRLAAVVTPERLLQLDPSVLADADFLRGLAGNRAVREDVRAIPALLDRMTADALRRFAMCVDGGWFVEAVHRLAVVAPAEATRVLEARAAAVAALAPEHVGRLLTAGRREVRLSVLAALSRRHEPVEADGVRLGVELSTSWLPEPPAPRRA